MATILIVSDQTINHRSLAALLGQHGHRVLEAPDGQHALELVRAEQPDLVVADILMPDVDGCQFVGSLSSSPGTAQPRVVLLGAACLEGEARALASACGVSHVVIKPVEPDRLRAVIEEALSRPPRRDGKADSEAGFTGADLHTIAYRLNQRVWELESLYAQLDRRMAEYLAQLAVARSALEQEVTKRIWAEKELTEANLRLYDKAVRDALTGLYNRRYLEESLEREVSRARRSRVPIGVMMMDIDHFKQCNDTFGHAAGDAVLRAVSNYVMSLTRSEDILCRYGGEEFVLAMVHASPRAVWERAEALRLGVQGLEVEHDGHRVGPVTLSIGIAMLPDHGGSGQEVLRAADAALYRAKQAGRNRVVIGEQEPAGDNAPATSNTHDVPDAGPVD
jgi:diguanylate cyclase (GGDEF)-like protein